MFGVKENKSFCTCPFLMLYLACMVANSESAAFRLRTKNPVTGERGGIISLPCNFSVHAHAVYWYKHNFTGAPDDRALLVARDYMGNTDPVSGFERFSITTDYSLTIRDIIVQDETTYSCVVYNTDLDRERGYTDLKVIAFRLHTKSSVTGERGGIISLPCTFSAEACAVYWYKHNFTGAPDDGASLIARSNWGIQYPVRGFERFSVTTDYTLIISDIDVQDETTYSCQVEVKNEAQRSYTDLRVIALAEPPEPIIESCRVMSRGRCDFFVSYDNSPENITLICRVYDVRPPPDLKWFGNDGKKFDASHQTQEKDGLSSISSHIQASASDLNQLTCQAEGEAVKGISSMTIHEYYVYDSGFDWELFWTYYVFVIICIWDLWIWYSICCQRCRRSSDTERREPDGIAMTVRRNAADEPDRDRRESNWWCSCGNCNVMQTGVESLCCREIDRCREIQTNGCIIDSKEFKDVCLDRSLIDTLLTLRSKDHKLPGNIGNESYRFAAYGIWSDYLHGYMGKGVRTPHPACVVTRVRQEFPDEASAYVEYSREGRDEESRSLLPNNHDNDEHSGYSGLKADSPDLSFEDADAYLQR